jgi:hypothetical protein
MKQIMRIKAVLLWTVAVLGVVVLVAFSQQQEQQSETVLDYDAYRDLMACKVADIYDLEEWFFLQQDFWMLLLPPGPDFILRQSASPAVLPFDWKDFPTDFVENLTWEYENSVPVSPITILEDPATRETVFLNGNGKEIYSLPPANDYDPHAFLKWMYPDVYSGSYPRETVAYFESLYDPARVWIETKLIPTESVELYLYTAARIREEAQKDDEGGGGDGMLLRFGEDYTNYLWVGIQGPAQGLTSIEIAVNIPDGFTNRVEIFTCTNLLDSWWTLAATNISTEGTNVVYWTYDLSGDASPVFFAAGNADIDSDGDGLTDAREKFLYHTDPNEWDTDGDGFSDGDEVNVYGTDPLDKYSVPAPQMLGTDGKYIVDESGNPVVLRSVNIGGWLQWEQWMLQYEPILWTNEWGKLYGTATNAADQLEEQTARELMINNVDFGVTLLAVSNNGASGVSTQTTWAGWLGDTGVKMIGDFHNGDWLCFSNVNFGSGVSNLAIGLAVPEYDAGKQIKVRLGSPTGTEIGSLTTKATSPDLAGWDEWCVLSEQCLTLSTNLSGTQTVYFVGSAGSGSIANLYRFRFWRDENTKALFETFRDNYFTTNDLDRIRELGYNCIRLPFFHHLLEDEVNPYTYKASGWARLDWVLEECRKRHLWVILDLHSTPGGQNPYHASGLRDPFKNRMWMSEFFKDRTAKLWGAIAARYATNPVVAGYDIFNEPDPSRTNDTKAAYQWAFSNAILPMVTRVHQAIRSNDTQHILFLESNLMYTNMWEDVFWWPSPSAMGWTNVCLEFHVYDQIVYGKNGVNDWWFSTQKGICDSMIRAFTRLSDARQVPVYVGEFAPWDEHNMEYWLRQCEANDLHWGHWNYRSWGWDDPTTPTKGRTVWGLDFRSAATTNQKPHLLTDSLATLDDKFNLYNEANYVDHPYLQKVVQNNATRTNAASERCEFYLNSFNAPNGEGLSAGWPWKKVAGVGTEANFWLRDQKARLFLSAGPLVLRYKSREEADARFEINDSTGCRFSVDLASIFVTNEVAGSEAEVRLACVRDEITTVASNYDTRGIIARLAYDKAGASTSVTLSLYSKGGGTNTYGVLLFASAPTAFVVGAPLELHVTKTNATLFYNGTIQGSASHTNLALDTWPNGAVALVEAAQIVNGTAQYMELDNLKAWRDTASTDATFANDFGSYVSGITLLSEPEYLTTQEYWAPSRKTESYATNAAAFWIAKEWAYGGTWMSPRRDYQDDVRLLASATNVVEARSAYSNLTQGVAKIVLLPESLTGEVYNDYAGPSLYVEFERQGGNVSFAAYRGYGWREERQKLQTNNPVYVEGELVSVQASTNSLRVYYGTDLVIDTPHSMTNFLAVYSNGAFPH